MNRLFIDESSVGEGQPEAAAEPPHCVFIVDDHPIFREGLCRVINAHPDLRVCGEASTAAEALEALSRTEADLAVVDLTLEQSNGMDLIKDLRVRYPKLPVLVVSNHDESVYAERCLRAGCRGYIMKCQPPADLVAGIRAALAGKFHVSEEMARRVFSHFSRASVGRSPQPMSALTDRELQVFELYGKGSSTRRIAETLHLSIKTVQAHREHIKSKLSLTSTGELLRSAVQWVESQSGL